MRELGGRCQECLVWTSEARLGAKQVSQVVGAGAHRWKKQGERATEYEREDEYRALAARLGDASSPGAPHSQMWAHPSK